MALLKSFCKNFISISALGTKYIYGLGVGFWTVSEILRHVNWNGWGIPWGIPGWRHWMRLVIRSNIIYGLVGIWIWDGGSELFSRWDGAYPTPPHPTGTHGRCQWMYLIIRNNDIYGLRVGIWAVSEILSLKWTEGGGVLNGSWDIKPYMKCRVGGDVHEE